MTCIIVGRPEEAGKFGRLDPAEIVSPEAFQQASGYMTRLIVIGPRLLSDRDIALADQVPAAFVLTNPTDVMHLEMHLRSGRLHLTPCDAVVVDDRLAHRAFAPWIDLLSLPADGLETFAAQQGPAPFHLVPDGFEVLTKPALSDLAAQMRRLQLTQYDCVVGSSPACRSLIGTLGNLANIALAEIESLPPDVICAEPGAVAEQLAGHPGCRLLICPVIVDADTPVEQANLAVTTATPAPANLVHAAVGQRLPQGRILASLIYAIG